MLDKAVHAARRLAAAATVAALVAGSAGAQITFAPLAGANGSPYTGHTENGFDVAPTAGDWHQAQVFGNPVPSVFGGPIGSPIAGTLRVTRTGGGQFTFGAVDLVAQNGFSDYLITGLLSGGNVFSQNGTVGPAAVFVTILSSSPAALIDELTISLTPDANASSFNVDNVDVAAAGTVPEPASVGLLAVGLVVVAVGARRRRPARSAP